MCTVFVALVSCDTLMRFTIPLTERIPLAELDHRSPAVHSQGPLLLLAVRSRPGRAVREKEWVAGGGARAVGGTDFPSC